MTYAEACRKAAKEWRKLAKRMAEGKSYRDDEFSGLCAEIMWGPITDQVRGVMGQQLRCQMDAMHKTWYADTGDMEARVVPCLLLALEAQEMATATPSAFDMERVIAWYFPEESVNV